MNFLNPRSFSSIVVNLLILIVICYYKYAIQDQSYCPKWIYYLLYLFNTCVLLLFYLFYHCLFVFVKLHWSINVFNCLPMLFFLEFFNQLLVGHLSLMCNTLLNISEKLTLFNNSVFNAVVDFLPSPIVSNKSLPCSISP